jgi:CheY-like chemotaxis protein
MPRVLVVDDSLFTRNTITKILTSGGHEVIPVDRGSDAVDTVEREKPDGMLLDLLMPDVDGYEVLRMLKEKALPVPVIIVSADIQETTEKECFELGAAGFLHKPVEEKTLLEVIQKVLHS